MLRTFRPDLVLYDAGVDPHAEDELGRLALSDEGLWRREMLVGCRVTAGYLVGLQGDSWVPGGVAG